MVFRIPMGGSFKGYSVQVGKAGIGFSFCLGDKKPDPVFSSSIGSPTDRQHPVRFKYFCSGIGHVFFSETKKRRGNLSRPDERVSLDHMVCGWSTVYF